MVHFHVSKRAHFDLRLESNGVLKSWAVPKQPPLKKGLKRLAIKVPDHALSYAKFEGIIKEGYGKGTVKIWDKGRYKKIKENVYEFKGKRLKGKYVLTPFKKRNYLLFKI